MVWTLPNVLTVARIAVTPVIALLPFVHGYVPKFIAFVVFIAAAVSDIYDGYLARERGQITDLGKLLDPLADKLLLLAALIPIYVLTRAPEAQYAIPWWNVFPLWAALLLIGRELVMTVVRQVAKGRGVVIPAGGAGKLKTVLQGIFIGAAFFWFAWRDLRAAFGWEDHRGSVVWEWLLGTVISVSLAAAVVLTAYSLIVYLVQYRHVLWGPGSDAAGDGR
jgi:CDP-diacylglycerol--glycerol-3-phosphate 3-phosphatidyltransferase